MFKITLCFILAGTCVIGASKYNVILVVFDDLRPVISGYGDVLAKTPNIDNFMRNSFYFSRAYSQQALCAPSRNSFLTGRRPDTVKLYDFYSYWRTSAGNFTTLPQYFKDNGYTTYSIGKIFHPGVSSNNNDDYPFSWSRPAFHPKSEKYMNSPVCLDGSGILKKNLICPVQLESQPLKTLPDIESVKEAKRFLDFEAKKPFFLALGFHKPHINFRFPKEFLDGFRVEDFQNYTEDSYKPDGMPNVAWNPFTDVRSRDDFKRCNISFPYGPIPSVQRAAIRQAYYASVAYVDDLFGKFLESVNRNNTVILITGDHGWSLGEHAEWAKYSNFEVAVRVPLIVQSPEFAISKPKRIKSIVEMVDIFPTLVDLAKLPQIPKCQQKCNQMLCTEGKSLYRYFIEPNRNDIMMRALSQYPRPGWEPTKYPNSDKPRLKNIKVMGYSMRTDNFRYTLWVKFHPGNFTKDWTQIYGEEMYDHRIDSGEFINLVGRDKFSGIRMWLRYQLIKAFSD